MNKKFLTLSSILLSLFLLTACTADTKTKEVEDEPIVSTEDEKTEIPVEIKEKDGETVFKAFEFKGVTYDTFKRSMEFFERGQDVSGANEYKTLESYKGKNVMVVFYVSWCKFCQEEIPSVIQLIEENKDKEDLEFLFINMTNSEESLENITKSVEDLKIPTDKLIMDVEGTSVENYEITGTPTTVFINKEQEIFSYNSGLTSKEALQFVIDEMYNQ